MALISAAGLQFDVSCIVLDKDGTLLDFDFTWGRRTADWIRALAAAIPNGSSQHEHFAQTIGYDWHSQKVLADGPIAVTTAQKLITLAAGALYRLGLPWHLAEEKAIQTIREEFGSPLQASEIRPLGNVKGAIGRFKEAGLILAVVTGDDRKPTMATLALLGILDQISVIVCGDDLQPEKPDPAALFHISAETGIPTRQMLMVGDTVNDMLTGRNASVAGCVGITGSTGDPSKLSRYADVTLATIEDLILI